LQPALDRLPAGGEVGKIGERKVVPLDLLSLKQRRDALALECSYQIDVLMRLANMADDLDSESQRAAVRSLSIRTRELTAILLSILHGDKGIGEWELRVFGSLQGSPTAPASDLVHPSPPEVNFEPI